MNYTQTSNPKQLIKLFVLFNSTYFFTFKAPNRVKMQKILRNISRYPYTPRIDQKRSFWEYVNMMFNKPDPDRIKAVGADRACAEWVLKNGGKIVWADGKRIEDYNVLPSDDTILPKIIEIDGTDSAISHYGFPHLNGCTMLSKIILHNNNYIDDRALKGLSYAKNTLSHLQISKCVNVTDAGLKELNILEKLQHLILFNLESVNDLEECKKYLKSQIPKCNIEGNPKQKNEDSL
ncbi:ATP synthase subunit s, mitochondrial [Bombyx mandarina]|uniref:ATP synthase subunit s, mitochondrial n=1 Tax=Bombyx mandarina TaxID=7092 RepID=A0A6J2JLI6_BOMMA|nr:ATP synthase subunit s, mitochondrial [Bombyx mandarina]